MNKELKPCPFCGGEADCNDSGCMQGGVFKWAVECPECGVISHCFDTETEAIEAWNTRKPIDKIVKQLEEKAIHSRSNAIEMTFVFRGEPKIINETDHGKAMAYTNAIEIVRGGLE